MRSIFILTSLLVTIQALAANPVVNVPAGADLVSLLAKSPGNITYVLALNSSYIMTMPGSISKPNISLNLNGSTLSSTYGGSAIAVHGDGFEIFGGKIGYAGTFVRSYASETYVHDLTIPDRDDNAKVGVFQFFMGDTGSNNAAIKNITLGLCDTVCIYWTQNNMNISNSTFKGSIGEDTLRQDVGVTNVLPTGAVLDGITADNHLNAYDKEAVAFRMGSGTIQNSTIHWYIRAGQSSATAIGSNVPSFIVKNTKFDGGNSLAIAIKRGVNAQVIGCTFNETTNHPPLDIDGNTNAVLTNNVVNNQTAGVRVHAFWETLSNPKVTETGTIGAP